MRLTPVLAAIACVLASLPATAASGEGSEPAQYNLKIERQPLSNALQEFAKQSGVQIIFFSKVTEGFEAPALRGRFTAAQAVATLLNDTKLTFRELDPVTIEVRPRAATQLLRGSEPPERMLSRTLAAAKGSLQSEGAQVPEASAPSAGTAAAKAEERSQGDQYLPRLEESGKAVPEMLVKERRTINADIKRTEDDPQPYVVFERAQIERSMSTSVEEFLYKHLPMNTQQGMRTQVTTSAPVGNQSIFSLRGLGQNQTLVLVDGRRIPSVNTFGTEVIQGDINGLPLAAIERIEVLPSTASGIYGGSATGGVINIITRKDYAGLELRATYGNVFDGDAASRRVDAAGGFSLEGGRTHVLITASHAETEILLGGDRDFAVRAKELAFANNPNALFTQFIPPPGRLTNIRSADGSNLVLDDGTPLDSPRTFVPPGYAGPVSDGGAALLRNAGQYDLGLPDDYSGAQRAEFTGPTVESASMNVRRAFGARVEAFLDLAWSDNHNHTQPSPTGSSTTLPADAPNNPFTTAINVRFPVVGLHSPEGESDLKTLRGIGGVIVRLPYEWTVAADYAWNRSRLFAYSTNPVGDPDGAGPGISASTAVANGTLDVLRDLNSFPLDYSPYLLPVNNSVFGPGVTDLKDATMRLSGPLFHLPGGPLVLSSIFEHRDEEAQSTFQDFLSANAVKSITYRPARSQTVDSFYLEAQAPLVSEANALRLVRALELQASVRHDEYQTRSPSPTFVTLGSRSDPIPQVTTHTNRVHATKYTLGLRYAPTEDVALRVSMGTGFLPPSVGQIVPAPLAALFPQPLIDPRRGGVAATVGPIPLASGGNPDLLSEESESWSAGLIFTPRFLRGLRLSVDYTHIDKRNQIGATSPQGLLNLEDFLPGRITRAPLTPADAALGYTGGVITAMDISSFNLSVGRLEAYDLQADYTWETERAGDFHLYTVVTRQPRLQSQVAPNSRVFESVGYNFGVLEWRGNAGLSWERGPWTINWDTEYYGSYRAYFFGSDPATIASTALTQGSDTIPSQVYHNLFAGYRFGETSLHGFLSNIDIMLGIQNVLDENPPIIAATIFGTPYSTYGDPRMRRFTLSVRKSF